MSVAETTQLLGDPVLMPVEQFTVMTGIAAVTVTGVLAVPETAPPVTVTLAVNVPAVVYTWLVEDPAVVVERLPSPKLQAYAVAGGAPFCAVAEAVSVVEAPTRIDAGEAASVTV